MRDTIKPMVDFEDRYVGDFANRQAIKTRLLKFLEAAKQAVMAGMINDPCDVGLIARGLRETCYDEPLIVDGNNRDLEDNCHDYWFDAGEIETGVNTELCLVLGLVTESKPKYLQRLETKHAFQSAAMSKGGAS